MQPGRKASSRTHVGVGPEQIVLHVAHDSTRREYHFSGVQKDRPDFILSPDAPSPGVAQLHLQRSSWCPYAEIVTEASAPRCSVELGLLPPWLLSWHNSGNCAHSLRRHMVSLVGKLEAPVRSRLLQTLRDSQLARDERSNRDILLDDICRGLTLRRDPSYRIRLVSSGQSSSPNLSAGV